MISSIRWVPAGIANPNPKKYEVSKAEMEMIEMLEKQQLDDNNNTNNLQQQEEQEQSSDDDDDETNNMKISSSSTSPKKTMRKKIQLPQIDASDLPADLRMDEYSSDEDDDDDEDGNGVVGNVAVGNLIVGNGPNSEVMDDDDDDDDEGNDGKEKHQEEEEDEEEADVEKEGKDKKKENNGSDNDSSDDDDDVDMNDLGDVPDTREYMPVDVDGLQAMGFSRIGNNDIQNDDDDDVSDVEDVRIGKDDAIVLVSKTEDDFSSLEVHVYDQKTGHLYVHHDIPLPAFPLCVAHGQVSNAGEVGNYCAVGTFDPGIEIWNLDVLNALEPSCILGGEDTTLVDDMMKLNIMQGMNNNNKKKQQQSNNNRSKPKGRGGGGLRHGSHTDAVMSLSWNTIHQQVIASGSADCTVKLWDVTRAGNDQQGCNAETYRHHRGKVQAVEWHPKEPTLLATGSYDHTVAILDARESNQSMKSIKKIKITSDVETICWDPFIQECLTVACEDGTILCYDVRNFQTNKPLWKMIGNEYGISDLTYNTHIPGFMATCSPDKTVTLWDTYHTTKNAMKEGGSIGTSTNNKPISFANKDMCVGKLYATSFYPSQPWLLGCGGSGNQLALWDFSSEDTIQKRFNDGRLQGDTTVVKDEQEEKEKEEDFQAMMAKTNKETATTQQESASSSIAKKKKNKGKKKAHRKGR